MNKSANVRTLLRDTSDLQPPAKVLTQQFLEHNMRLRAHVMRELKLKFKLLPPAVHKFYTI